MSNLSDITSKVLQRRHVCSYLLVSILHIEFVGMIMICPHTKFRKPISNGSLVIAIEL